MADRRVSRTGFTLIELIVVMAILAVLVSLSLPALGRARASALRVQCLNNLRNIALALTQFEQAQGRLPASGTYWHDERKRSHPHASWAVFILPWIDQKTLYDRWDLDRPLTDRVNRPLTRVHIPLYVCPADISRSKKRNQGDLSYVVNGGVGFTVRYRNGVRDCPVDRSWTVLDLNGNGVGCPADPEQDASESGVATDKELFKRMGLFFLETWNTEITRRHYRLADVQDGLTTTFLVTENVRAGYDPRDPRASYASPNPYRCAFYIGNPCPTGRCGPDEVDYSLSNAGRNRINSGLWSAEGRSPVPNSFHSGGVNMAYADGHVQFLSETVDGAVYAALASPQGLRLAGTPLEQPVVSGTEF